MTSLALFGLRLAPLYFAISQVESERGATSDNVYQIRNIYVDDVNRINGDGVYTYRDVNDIDASETMMYIYWQYYGNIYQQRTGKPVTYEVLARIHNGGPNGWRMYSTKRYWHKVRVFLGE